MTGEDTLASDRTRVRGLLLALIGAAAMLAPHVANAAGAELAVSQAECERLRTEMGELNHRAQNQRDGEMEALKTAAQAEEAANKVRSMKPYDVNMARLKAEGELSRQIELRNEEDRGAAFSKRDPYIIKLRTWIQALKDAELRVRDNEETGGFIGSDRNALDTFARDMRARAAKAGQRAEDLEQQGKARRQQLDDCLRQLQRLKSETGRGDASGLEGEDPFLSSGADPISDAEPMGPPVYAPPVDQGGYGPASPTYWPPAGYPPGYTRGPGRGGGPARGPKGKRGGGDMPGWGDQNGQGGKGGQGGQGGRGKGGGKGGKGHQQGGACHTEPLTGALHCGEG